MKVFLPILFILLLTACEENIPRSTSGTTSSPSSSAIDPEELIREWSESLRVNDTAAIDGIFTDDVVIFLGTQTFAAAQAKQWIKNNRSLLSDLRTEAIAKGSYEKVTYYSGTFTHAFGMGTITLIMERQPADTWMIRSAHISTER